MESQRQFQECYKGFKYIGRGGSGNVYKVKKVSQVDEQEYCAKIMDLQMAEDVDYQKKLIYNEIEVLQKLQHKNIIQFVESFEEEKYIIIVMEYASHGSLDDEINQRRFFQKYFEEDDIINIFIQILEGIRYIHSKNVLHRDIKPDNIFLGSEGKIKIGDFGISRKFETKKLHTQTMIGTPYYVSPELLMEQDYSFKSDAWALGCVLYELCFLNRAFDGIEEDQISRDILQNEPDYQDFKYSDQLLQLIQCILIKDQKERPSIDEIFECPLIFDYLEKQKKQQNIAELSWKYAKNFNLDNFSLKKVNLNMEKSEISDKNRDYITDIARLDKNQKDINDLDFKSDQAELILEKVRMVSKNQNTVNILATNLFENKDNKYNLKSLQENILNVYRHHNPEKAEDMLSFILEKMNDKNIQEFINKYVDGEAIAMALIYYMRLKSGNLRVQEEASFILQKKQSSPQDIKQSNLEINYWINRGLLVLEKYVGECAREIQIYDEELIDYFRPGKIFQWNQFSAAFKGDSVPKWKKEGNVIFHISGQTCGEMEIFSTETNKNLVVFGLQTEFLTCRKQLINGKYHIDLREIKTGIEQNVFMWVDDKNFPDKNIEQNKNNLKLYNYIRQETFEQNLHIILKQSTDTAMAYIKSPLFKASLQVCKYFKLVSNVYRDNESNGRSKELAGPKFIKEFIDTTKDFQEIKKVKTMIYCGNIQSAKEKCQNEGLLEDNPKITNKPTDFVKFLLE